MTLPSSGAITLSDIQTEFGGTNPISLSEYYAGGSYVPSGTTGVNGAVPSSGAISMSHFYGTTAVSINLSGQFISTITGGLSDATSGYRLSTDGNVYNLEYSTYNPLEVWNNVPATVGNYEARATLTSGDTLTVGVVGAWLSLGVDLDWELTAPMFQQKNSVLTIEIRNSTSLAVVATASIDLTSDALA